MTVDREALRLALVAATGGCAVQHDGWPCNTCFHDLVVPHERVSGRQVAGLTRHIHDYWLAVLEFRGDYPQDMPDEERNALLRELFAVLWEDSA